MNLSLKSVDATRVAVSAMEAKSNGYPASPFHPSQQYPEYKGPTANEPNPVYDLVRNSLAALKLDEAHFDSSTWNPLGDLVQPGSKIVIKPNWVLDHNEGPGGTECLITHASVLRAILDYVWLTQPREVIVGDAPLQVCDLPKLLSLGFNDVQAYYRAQGRNFVFKDFRRTVTQRSAGRLDVVEQVKPESDYTMVDLGKKSFLEEIASSSHRFRVTMYDPQKIIRTHRPGTHCYLVARDVLDADLVINVPKLKTHKKAGITASLKNLVGINGNKDYLPHHRKGGVDRGGDNYLKTTLPKRIAENILDFANRYLTYPRFYMWLARIAYKFLFFDKIRGLPTDIEGGWYGNDTVWRMCLDLNRLLFYADTQGSIHSSPQRNVLTIADGFIAGQGNGPLQSDPCNAGLVMASLNPVVHDFIAGIIMGLDPHKIPIICHAFDPSVLPLTTITEKDIFVVWNGKSVPPDQIPNLAFIPPDGWKNHCERSA